MDISLIGEQIQKFRKARGLTQRELGAAIGVSTQAVSQWENGGAPDVALLPAIADRLCVTVDALFGREGGEVRDMRETFLGWLHSLPERERLSRINRLLWEAALYGVSESLVGRIKIDYPETSEFDMPEQDAILMRTVLGTRSGYILGVGAEDFSFMGVFPEPEGGYERYLLDDEKYRELFAVLASPGALEALRYFCRGGESYFVPSVVARDTGLPLEDVQRALEALDGVLGQMVRREITLPEGPVNAYAFMDDGSLVALLDLARWLMQTNHTYLTANILRGQSLDRREAEHEKA